MLNTPDGLDHVQVKILDKRIGDTFPLPQYATTGSAGMDMYACIDEPTTLQPGETQLISTGISVFVANPNYAAVLLPRSGMGHKHGMVLGNLVGLIDSDYQGPLMVSVWNRSSTPYTLEPGDRMAQLLFVPIARPGLQVVDAFESSERGEGGFGSTGIGAHPAKVP